MGSGTHTQKECIIKWTRATNNTNRAKRGKKRKPPIISGRSKCSSPELDNTEKTSKNDPPGKKQKQRTYTNRKEVRRKKTPYVADGLCIIYFFRFNLVGFLFCFVFLWVHNFQQPGFVACPDISVSGKRIRKSLIVFLARFLPFSGVCSSRVESAGKE